MSPRAAGGFERPKGMSSVARPPRPSGATQRPGGSKRYGLHRAPQEEGGPGPPPAWFLSGNVGADEWPFWWACRAVFRQPPGQGEWLFQTRIAAQLPGGIKPDFVFTGQFPNIVARVQSDYLHVAVPYNKFAYDREQRLALENFGFLVIDVYPQYYLVDDYGVLTGQAAIRTVHETRQGRQRMNPRGTMTSWARA